MLTLDEMIPSLCGVMSVTGFEGTEKEKVKALVTGYDECVEDAVGNLIFIYRCGRKNAPRILIDTHFDEIGMIVTDIRERGFLSFARVGGLDMRTLSSTDVLVWGERVIPGVISSTPPHLVQKGGKQELPDPDDLLIDTGMETEELKKFVRVGTPVGFAPRYRQLAGRRMVGKGFDNKACAAVAAHALGSVDKQRLAGDVYLVFSVQEEIGGGGVAAGAYGIDPHYAMVIDVNLAFMPGAKTAESVAMQKGPSIARGVTIDKTLRRMTEALCTRENIPWQPSVAPVYTGTNTEDLHLVRAGIPTVDVGLPLVAMHTYTEELDLDDAEALARLVSAFVTDREIGEVFSC